MKDHERLKAAVDAYIEKNDATYRSIAAELGTDEFQLNRWRKGDSSPRAKRAVTRDDVNKFFGKKIYK